MGQIDAAAAEREKAAAKLMKHEEAITTLAVDKYKLDQEAKSDRDRNATSIQVANIGLEGHRISAAGSRRDFSQITGSTAAIMRQKAWEDAVKMTEAYYREGMKDAKGHEITEEEYLNNKYTVLSDKYLEAPQSTVEQPKPQMQAPPTVGEVRDGYKYNGGAYDSESSWSKV
jgi:hypothetical protein